MNKQPIMVAEMKRTKKCKYLLVLLAFTVLLLSIGHLSRMNILAKKNLRIPKIPKTLNVPKYFYDYRFLSLNYFKEDQNWYIEKFYHTWKNKGEYGIYEEYWGLDSLISCYWLTKNGTIFLLTIDDEGHLRPKHYSFREVNELEMYYWDENEQFTRVDPNIFSNREFVFTHELILKGKPSDNERPLQD